MSTRQKEEGKSSADESDDIGGSCRPPHVPQQQDEVLSRGVERRAVTDTKRTILSHDRSHALDPDVEADALMSSEPDERSCFQSNNPTGYWPSPPVKARDDTSGSAGLQESVTTTDGVYYARTAAGGRSTAGETVRLMSAGATGNWNMQTVVLPVDDQRMSVAHQSAPLLPAVSPQVRTEVYTPYKHGRGTKRGVRGT